MARAVYFFVLVFLLQGTFTFGYESIHSQNLENELYDHKKDFHHDGTHLARRIKKSPGNNFEVDDDLVVDTSIENEEKEFSGRILKTEKFKKFSPQLIKWIPIYLNYYDLPKAIKNKIPGKEIGVIGARFLSSNEEETPENNFNNLDSRSFPDSSTSTSDKATTPILPPKSLFPSYHSNNQKGRADWTKEVDDDSETSAENDNSNEDAVMRAGPNRNSQEEYSEETSEEYFGNERLGPSGESDSKEKDVTEDDKKSDSSVSHSVEDSAARSSSDEEHSDSSSKEDAVSRFGVDNNSNEEISARYYADNQDGPDSFVKEEPSSRFGDDIQNSDNNEPSVSNQEYQDAAERLDPGSGVEDAGIIPTVPGLSERFGPQEVEDNYNESENTYLDSQNSPRTWQRFGPEGELKNVGMNLNVHPQSSYSRYDSSENNQESPDAWGRFGSDSEGENVEELPNDHSEIIDERIGPHHDEETYVDSEVVDHESPDTWGRIGYMDDKDNQDEKKSQSSPDAWGRFEPSEETENVNIAPFAQKEISNERFGPHHEEHEFGYPETQKDSAPDSPQAEERVQLSNDPAAIHPSPTSKVEIEQRQHVHSDGSDDFEDSGVSPEDQKKVLAHLLRYWRDRLIDNDGSSRSRKAIKHYQPGTMFHSYGQPTHIPLSVPNAGIHQPYPSSALNRGFGFHPSAVIDNRYGEHYNRQPYGNGVAIAGQQQFPGQYGYMKRNVNYMNANPGYNDGCEDHSVHHEVKRGIHNKKYIVEPSYV